MSDCSLYPEGQCTRYVCETWPYEIGPVWGNADQWLSSAAAAGYSIGRTPEVGAIAVWSAYSGGALAAGHVAIVESVTPLVVVGEDWPVGAGVVHYQIDTPGAPGPPSGYIYAPAKEETVDTPTAEAIVWLERTMLFGEAWLKDPDAQAAVSSYASRLVAGENPEQVLTDQLTDAQRDPRLLPPYRTGG